MYTIISEEKMSNLKTITADLPVDVLNMIYAIAAEKQRQFSEIVNDALLSYVNEWEEYKIAVRRLKDPSDAVLTENEFLSELREDFGWKV